MKDFDSTGQHYKQYAAKFTNYFNSAIKQDPHLLNLNIVSSALGVANSDSSPQSMALADYRTCERST